MRDDELKEIEVSHSTLESVDQAAYDWLNGDMAIS